MTDLLHGGAVIPDVVPRAWRRRDYLRAYVGSNWGDFASVFDDMEKRPRLVSSWSWTAALVPAVWLAYRKRYIWAVAMLVANVAVGHLLRGVAHLVVALAITVLLGCFGKALYVRSALSDIDAILRQTADQHQRVALVSAKGGVSDKSIVVIVSVLLALWFIYIIVPFSRW